ncbi:MAG: vWA domain-containing protein [Vibrio sp.]
MRETMFNLNLEFAHPWWLLILPLPFIIYWFIPAYQTRQTALKVPFFKPLLEALGETPTEGASVLRPTWWQHFIITISWLLIVLALTQPTLLGKPQTRESSGRDVMILVDLSGSMDAQDFTTAEGEKTDRLTAVKQVLTEFINQREGDRFGLILFGDSAFVQAPFTADHKAWLELLDEAQTGMAGQSTHLGDAIGLGIKTLEDNSLDDPDKQKLAIVLTDGNDTDSYVAPVDAAKVAKAKDVKIHIIAMGDPKTQGEDEMNMDIIHDIAQQSGGQAFQALDRDSLEKAYATINELEPSLYQSTTYRPKISLHYYFMALLVIMHLGVYSWATYSMRRHRRGASDV